MNHVDTFEPLWHENRGTVLKSQLGRISCNPYRTTFYTVWDLDVDMAHTVHGTSSIRHYVRDGV